jgi:hypothetical protein
MTTSTLSKRALSSAKPKPQTLKAGTTRTRMQTEKGKNNAHRNQKQAILKGVIEGSSSEDSEEDTRQPHKKHSRLAKETDSKEVGRNASSVENVDTTDGNGSESDFRMSVQHSLVSLQDIANE